jgi:hypothetical protein
MALARPEPIAIKTKITKPMPTIKNIYGYTLALI